MYSVGISSKVSKTIFTKQSRPKYKLIIPCPEKQRIIPFCKLAVWNPWGCDNLCVHLKLLCNHPKQHNLYADELATWYIEVSCFSQKLYSDQKVFSHVNKIFNNRKKRFYLVTVALSGFPQPTCFWKWSKEPSIGSSFWQSGQRTQDERKAVGPNASDLETVLLF